MLQFLTWAVGTTVAGAVLPWPIFMLGFVAVQVALWTYCAGKVTGLFFKHVDNCLNVDFNQGLTPPRFGKQHRKFIAQKYLDRTRREAETQKTQP